MQGITAHLTLGPPGRDAMALLMAFAATVTASMKSLLPLPLGRAYRDFRNSTFGGRSICTS